MESKAIQISKVKANTIIKYDGNYHCVMSKLRNNISIVGEKYQEIPKNTMVEIVATNEDTAMFYLKNVLRK